MPNPETPETPEPQPQSTPTKTLLIATGMVVILTLTSGVIHGRLTNRWAVAADLQEAGKLLQELPANSLGDWQFEGKLKFDETSIKMLECTGYISRVYVNQRTGDTIRMFVIVGPRGPISVHTPDVCFSSRAYRLAEPLHREALSLGDGQEQVFWESVFESREALDPHELIAWHGWSTGEGVSAPKYQRIAFISSPKLYKIQLSCRVRNDRQATEKLMAGFVRNFLPHLQPHMK